MLRHLLPVLALLSGCLPAHAGVPDLDLGAHPANGAVALQGMRAREDIVIHAFACREEVRFLDDVDYGQRRGAWPIGHLIAKAAHIGRTTARCNSEETPESWRGLFYTHGAGGKEVESYPGGDAAWRTIQALLDGGDRRGALEALVSSARGYYGQRFGPDCDYAVMHTRDGRGVQATLTPACMAAQIRTVLEDPRLGAWTYEENGDTVARYPGTSADALPCVLEGRVEGKPLTGGDWDMSVIEYSRLAALLERVPAANPALAPDVSRALLKLDHWLLTLRGGPARESYDVLWSCGNPDNSFGSAQDYVGGTDVYNDDVARALPADGEDEDSFWDDFLKFLLILAIVAAIAFTAGAAAGAALGAGTAAAGTTAAVTAGAVLVTVVLVSIAAPSIQETENHLFMQNTSKYLKNKRMILELQRTGDADGIARIQGENRAVREWLLRRLSRVAQEDFIEYNAKPYARLTHMAILNLADFACPNDVHDVVIVDGGHQAAGAADVAPTCDKADRDIRTAASAVLDLSAAKVALGSLQGRRVVPFRRLVSENARYAGPWTDHVNQVQAPKRVMDLAGGSDHMVAALQFWAGTSQHGPSGHASRDSGAQMLWHATSHYRPHALLLDLALDKSAPVEQSFRHAGAERYSGGPRWLLTAGGDTTPKANGLELLGGWALVRAGADDDRGAGVPTTLMATTPGGRIPDGRRDAYADLLRFEGRDDRWDSDGVNVMRSFAANRCVGDAFACGLNLRIPAAIAHCLDQDIAPGIAGGGSLRFLSSTGCAAYQDGDGDASNDFMLAVYGQGCRRDEHGDACEWGFVEVAEAVAFGQTLATYRDAVVQRNGDLLPGWANGGAARARTFVSVARDREVRFTPADEDFDRNCRACGTIVNHRGGARFSIANPRHPGAIEIDLDDPLSPSRTLPAGTP